MLILDKFRRAVKSHNLIQKADRVIVGLSSGADSLALLYLLNSISREFRLTLHIAHLNHKLRGGESDGDMDFALGLAEKLNIAITVKVVQVKNIPGASLEEKARLKRLEFFSQVALKYKIKKVALGHNRDDQAETILMRLLRGSGLLGLSGMLPLKKMRDFVIIRPLIDISRREIEVYLRTRKICPRTDSSNRDDAYFRNRIRHKLLPELESYNPNIREVLANSAQAVAADYEFISDSSRKQMRRLISKNPDSKISLPLNSLFKLHPALRNMILRLVFEELKGDTRRLTYKHIKELNDLLNNRPLNSIIDLPAGISFKKDTQRLRAYLR